MPHPQATLLDVSPAQQDILKQWERRTTRPQLLVTRARIILAAGAGTSNSQIAKQVQVHYETVQRWRDRWGAAETRLQAIEATGKPKLLSQAIEVLLADEPRP